MTCELCGEPQNNEHVIDAKRSARVPPRRCGCCGSHAVAVCIPKARHHVYRCRNGHLFGDGFAPANQNCDEPSKPWP